MQAYEAMYSRGQITEVHTTFADTDHSTIVYGSCMRWILLIYWICGKSLKAVPVS